MNLLLESLKALLFGIVEGVTEWLPISSTGHMILLDEFIQLQMTDAFKSMFEVVIQLGAILAVVVLYFSKLWPFKKPKKGEGFVGLFKMETVMLWLKVVVAILPSAIVGIPFDDWMDALRLHIRKEANDVRRCLRALDGRFEMYGEDYKKLAVPADVPEDLRALYVKKHFGFEHNGTQADWALWHTHDMADAIAADLSRMAPLHQLMRRMRDEAEHAAQEAVREREARARAEAQTGAAKPGRLVVRSADEFEF